MDTADARLAEAMRMLRRESGRSLKELERLTATSDSSLSRYVNGTATPPWSVVDALCQAVGRDPAELRDVWEDARRSRLDRYGGRGEDGRPPVVGTDLVTTRPVVGLVVPRGVAVGLVTVVVGVVAAALVVLLGRSAVDTVRPCPGCASRSRLALLPPASGRR